MKKQGILFVLLLFFAWCAVLRVSAQDKSRITVRGSELNNGVVILDIAKEGRDYRLQCNQGAPGCVKLKDGKYVMHQLPENFGMYDCKNVEVYPETAAGQENDTAKKLGEYCLVEK